MRLEATDTSVDRPPTVYIFCSKPSVYDSLAKTTLSIDASQNLIMQNSWRVLQKLSERYEPSPSIWFTFYMPRHYGKTKKHRTAGQENNWHLTARSALSVLLAYEILRVGGFPTLLHVLWKSSYNE